MIKYYALYLIFNIQPSAIYAFVGDSTQTKNNTIHRVKEIVRISNHGKEFEQLIETDNRFFWVSYVRARHESWNNQEDLNDDLDDLYSFFRVKL